jgi:hypothetical protein
LRNNERAGTQPFRNQPRDITHRLADALLRSAGTAGHSACAAMVAGVSTPLTLAPVDHHQSRRNHERK